MSNDQRSNVSSQALEGHKQTEIGLIPEDWQVVYLRELGNFKNGINKNSEAFGHGHPFVNLMDVFGVVKIDSLDFLGLVETNSTEQQTYDLKQGDVLFIRSSVKPSGVGLTAVIEVDLPKTVYSGFLIRFRDYGTINFRFKQHCFYEEGFRKRLIASSSVSANTNINQDNLKLLPIALPSSLIEQEAIAQALSDTDTLIESLEQLIAKKHLIKQGAMQELLTGKRRSPGFDEKQGCQQTKIGVIPKDWSFTRLEKISAFITKGTTPTTYGFQWVQQGVLFLRSECVSDNGLDLSQSMFISPKAHATLNRSALSPGDILITITGNVGRVIYLDESFKSGNMNQHIARIRIVNDQVSAKFIYHFLNQHSIRQAFNTITTGQAYPQISLKQVRDAVVPLPSFAEQEAIATILSDMDTEIAALETKLAKTREIKQGMMHELLTGRIRLVEGVES